MAAWMSTSAGTAASAVPDNMLKIHNLSPPRNPIRASLQSLQRAFRRSDGHGAGWPPPATARVGAVSLPDGVEPLQSADRRGTRPEYVGRAGDDRTSAQRSGGADTSRQTARRGRDR